jgi:DNA-directed RNA polymerase subunit M/transcription elongation factor TFIIS
MIRKQRFIEKKQRMLEQCKQEQDRELIRRQVDYLAKQAEMLRRQQKMVENRKQKEDEAWMREQEKIASGGHIKKEDGEKDKKGDNKAWTWGWVRSFTIFNSISEFEYSILTFVTCMFFVLQN